jgi:hypothetical protein
MTNMMDMHTCSVCGVDLVIAPIAFLHGELVKLGGEVVSCTRVHIPAGIDVVGGSVATRAVVVVAVATIATIATMSDHGSLAVIVAPVSSIVPEAEEFALETLEALRGNMIHLAAELAQRTWAILALCPIADEVGRWQCCRRRRDRIVVA